MQTRFAHAYVLNVLADDHPGIIAAVSAAIDERRGNIDACSQTVLEGFFTLIMVVSLPEPASADVLAGEVSRNGDRLQVMARPLSAGAAPAPGGQVERFVLTAFGPDKPGIIRQFTRYLAGKDINIVDFYGEREGEDLVLISELDVPTRLEVKLLQADLEEIGRREDYTVRLQHEGIFVATNQLRLVRR